MQFAISSANRWQSIVRTLGYAFALTLILIVITLSLGTTLRHTANAIPSVRALPTLAPASYNFPAEPVYYNDTRDDGYMGSYGG